jgi:transposase
MSKQVTTSPAKLFIGLDIHKKTWKFHFATDIVIGSGHSFPPCPETINKYVVKNYKNYEVSLAYEAGCCGYNPARAFMSYGWDTYVINPADIPRPAKNSFIKTDKIDAKNIALQLRSAHLKKLVIPEQEREALRCLTRQRTALVRDFRRVKSRIKSLLLYHQIHIPDGMDTPKWPKKFIVWLKELSMDFNNNLLTLQSMIAQYEFVDQQLKQISNLIRAYCRKHYKKDYYLLKSVPGIAGLTASYMLAELGDIRRFSSMKKFASYVGFIPGMHQSGGAMYTTGPTPRANRHVRNLIVEASWIAIRTDPVMQNYYRSHAGKNSKAVIFKVGRKLLSKILAVIKTEIPYSIGVVS